jgi:hypothetical protein
MLAFTKHLTDKDNVSVNYIGSSQSPVILFDLNLDLSDFLISKASTYKMDWIPASNFYPGIWSKVPVGFCSELQRFIKPYIDKYFLNYKSEVSNIYSCYAMAVKDKNELAITQKIPHFDSFSPTQIAAVLYLCDEEFGSTAFYRHKNTKIEKVTQDNKNHYMHAIKKELDGLTDQLTEPCDLLFEKTFECKAKKGRLLLYPSAVFHNGIINKVNHTQKDPKKGRLTITSFINYKEITEI